MNLVSNANWIAAAEAPAAVTIRGVRKAFTAGRQVLNGVDLTIRSGSITALIGANGTGKSTLMRMIPRLVHPDAGVIHVLASDVGKAEARELRKLRSRIGFVFQKHNLCGRLSALSNVVHGAQARGIGVRAWCQGLASHATRQKAMECLDRVGLAHVAAQRADSLSGGQSQRVAIARVLMQEPEIVLADEPVASLDPQAGEDVMQLLLSLMREERRTVLFTSHHLPHALEFADRVVGLAAGQVALDAPAAGLYERDLRTLYG